MITTEKFASCENCSRALIDPCILEKASLDNLYHRPVHADWRNRFRSSPCQDSLEGLGDFENLGEIKSKKVVSCHFCKRQTWRPQILRASVFDI